MEEPLENFLQLEIRHTGETTGGWPTFAFEFWVPRPSVLEGRVLVFALTKIQSQKPRA